ncbi:nicotinate-nucleotide--dimethylbenzimidazole phosphoribosyltransferase [Streptomyces sp. NPDC006662]|uniref:nicotinate-nucleotide--dimethylbenzimidazole phosphoribosyltransferase n=1 Tax=Streptomyces sp. NPDC006662 TaxID=3156902 RepID=UPI003400F319
MTDTGQVPGEGHPDNTGMVDQQGGPAPVPPMPPLPPMPPAGYAFQDLVDDPAEDEELLLMPSGHGQGGAWSDPQVVPPVPSFPGEYPAEYPAEGGYAEYPQAQAAGYPEQGHAGFPEGGYAMPGQDGSLGGQAAPGQPGQEGSPGGQPGPDGTLGGQPVPGQAQHGQPVQEGQLAGQALLGQAGPDGSLAGQPQHAQPQPGQPEPLGAQPGFPDAASVDASASDGAFPDAAFADAAVTGAAFAEGGAEGGADPGAYSAGAHEAGGRDSGSLDLGGLVAQPGGHAAAGQTPHAVPVTPSRRPLHMGPPMPDATGGVVRSLADRGPAAPPSPVAPAVAVAPPAQAAVAVAAPAEPGAETPGAQEPSAAAQTVTPGEPEPAPGQPAPNAPEYLDAPAAPQLGGIPPQAGAPWTPEQGPEQAAPVTTGTPGPEGRPAAESPTGPRQPAPEALPGTEPQATPGQPVAESPAVPEPVAAEGQAAAEGQPAVDTQAGTEGQPVPGQPVAEAQDGAGAQPAAAAPSVTDSQTAAEGRTTAEPAASDAQPQAGHPAVEGQAAADGQVPDAQPAAEGQATGEAAAAPEAVAAPEADEADEAVAAAEGAPAPVADAAVAEAPAEPATPGTPGQPEAQAAPAETAAEAVESPAEQAEPAAEPAPAGDGEAPAEPQPSPGEPAPGYADAEREAVLRVMRERRDIRNGFRTDPIPHEVLLRVLEAAHHAPSVGHSQPWDFVVIRSAETRRTMHELAQRQREAYAKSLPKGRAKQFKELKIEAILDTPVNIVVTADPTRGGRHTLGRHTQPQMAPYSSALAVENLWLAARAEGLGVGWVSFFDEREMVRALGLPEHLEVVAYLCVGYVDEFPEEPELMQAGWAQRRPLAWVVHEETYGRRALPGEDPHDLLSDTVASIRPLDAKALGEAWERQKRMTKPAGALGMLEIISAQLAGLSRVCPPPIPEPAAVAIFAGDHGVHAQGVTPWPQEVTTQMVANFLGGGAVCNAFANQVGAEVCVVDVGVKGDLPATPGLLPRKVRPGTDDLSVGAAMSREDAVAAIEVGIETARDLVAAGNKALLTGEMGIANTTVSAALISVFTGVDPVEVTGRGTGINDETHARKVDVVRRALELHQPDPNDPVGVLAAIGGLEHAAIVGLILGGASLRTPVILDGVSAGAAALVARAIAPEALSACIAGHRSAEPGHVAALNKLGLRPLVDLDLRLGEGTGALLALPLVQSAARAMHEVATFDSAGVTEK